MNSIDINITSPKVDVNLEVVTAQEAKDKASEAATSATNAANSATNAAVSETNAFNSATSAADSETAAKASETAAKASETNAKASATAAAGSAAQAGAFATTATDKASEADKSADAAKASETAAAASEGNAADSATNAHNSELVAVASETAAKASETAAKASETAAKASETAAKASETAAKASQSAAKTSETNAASSKSAAATSAANAAASETAAKASETAAKTSETNAKTSESNAAASKSAAATSASAAKTSEQNAGTQANTAKAWATSTTSPDGAADTASTTGKTQSAKSWALYSKDKATASASSASAAATSASAAKTSETNAASSKSAAATSATNAANSAKAAAASATAAANSAREQQADWNVTDTTSKAFVKNKPTNLSAIGNTPKFSLNTLYKSDYGGNPVYFLMHELVQYNPDKFTFPISAVYGFNGMVFGDPRLGGGGNQFLAIVKVGLGYEYNNLYSSSGHYSPVVIKDETNDKYYWAMKINGSYQNVYMLGAFSANPLNTVIPAVDRAGTLPEGWSLVHTAKPYPFDNTNVASADKDGQGNTIDTTYLKKSDAATSLTTNTLTATNATFTGETSVPTANAGNSSKAIANTEFVAKSLAALVNGAPDQLNTLNELAKALGNDSNFSATVTAELAKKLNSAEAESTYATKQEARVLPGTVTAFSGTFKDGYPIDKNTGLVDKEWHLCDGTNGTPDLRNRFIYGGDGSNNGATGGEASHALTEAEHMPPYYTLAFIMKL